MEDRSISMREGEAGLDQLAIDLIKEAELDRIGRRRPDSEVASLLGQASTEVSLICWLHVCRVMREAPKIGLLMSNIRP